MAIKTVYVCDVCGDEPKDDDLSSWRIVNIRPLVDQPLEALPVGAPQVPAPSMQDPAMLCHKVSCLTRWAKDQNEAK